jgi:pimeloyl-ACP methyl ester carboxylesterase
MPRLAVDDRVVTYEDYGTGPVAVLVHGSPGNGKAWQRVGERLAASHRVVAPDLPGHGGTTPQPPDATPDLGYSATLVEALVDAVGPASLVVGYSYGAVVALAVALRGQVPIGALVLLEPVAVPALSLTGDETLHERTRAVFERYIADVEAGDPTRVQMMVDFWFGPGAFARMPQPLRAYMVREAATNVRDVRGTLRQEYSVSALGRLAMPVTVVVGGRSPEVTWAIARVIAAHVAKGSLIRLDGADHAMITTHDEALALTVAGLIRPSS